MTWDGGERRLSEISAEKRQHNITVAAAEAAKVVSDAAVVAVKTIADAASVAQAVINTDIGYIKKDIGEIKTMLENKYITRDQFTPVKMIAYGLVSLVLIAVVGSVMSFVLTRRIT